MNEIVKVSEIEAMRLGNSDGATPWRRKGACVLFACPEGRGNDALCHSSLDSSRHTGAPSKNRTPYPSIYTKDETTCEYFELLYSFLRCANTKP